MTMVSDFECAAYSGMLPGHISGFYQQAALLINLRHLCKLANVQFIHAKVRGMNLKQKQVLLDSGAAPLAADLVSINVGGIPDMDNVEGAKSWAIPAKPVPRLLEGWASTLAAAENSTGQLQIILAGGGAGGVELALAMRSRLQHAEFTIIHSGARLLPEHNSCAQHIARNLLLERNVVVITEAKVVEVMPQSVRLDDGRRLASDFVFWVTQVAPPGWLGESGLDITREGFIRVKPTLQAINYPWIFAAGDAASIESQKLPKSGVFAVRMAKPLEYNLRACLGGSLLKDYKPQRHSLSLIGTADGRAIASYSRWAAHSAFFWWLKNQIDRRFMRQFQ
ncbi:pyridine nucleotide-disulfide oxidoreductase family protein [Nitrosospira sp. Nsp11]|nr:pyridine nucleotide-disulfide oxidoreductase family protein [Nitrosospira sp. Nsp11]